MPTENKEKMVRIISINQKYNTHHPNPPNRQVDTLPSTARVARLEDDLPQGGREKSANHSYHVETSAPAVTMPSQERNYCVFNQDRVNYFVSQKERALPYLKNVLQTSQDEMQIVEILYIMDRMIDNGTKGIAQMYPVFSRFNDTKSPNIQVYLAGIYRKTQVPDAFGPLVKMLVQNSLKAPDNKKPFDPNEEIGGAILEYIRNYSNNPKSINYTI